MNRNSSSCKVYRCRWLVIYLENKLTSDQELNYRYAALLNTKHNHYVVHVRDEKVPSDVSDVPSVYV